MDVRTLCLGALTLGDMTGYEIKKIFEQSFSHFFVAGFGSIYPALGALTGEGLVECRDVAQARRPDKKVYRLTPAGHDALEAALATTAPRHKVRSEFFVLLYFAHLLAPERLEAVIDERERDVEALLAHIDDFESGGDTAPGPSMVAGLGRASLEAQLDYLRANRARLLGTASARADQAADRTANDPIRRSTRR